MYHELQLGELFTESPRQLFIRSHYPTTLSNVGKDSRCW